MSSNRQVKEIHSLDIFLSTHPVFTLSEINAYLTKYRTGNVNTRKALLNYYKTRNRIISIRRGLFAVIPKGYDPVNYQIDPMLVASRLASDSILSYHTALEYHGKAYTVSKKITYTSSTKAEPFHFQGYEYHRVTVPPGLRKKNALYMGTITANRNGLEITVTDYERTLVDTLDRPDLSGSWEEIWRSLESIEFIDQDRLYEYIILLGNNTTIAKVGFFLEQHRESFMVDDAFLTKLEQFRPKQPHYAERSNRNNCRLLNRWNLLVPEEVLNRSWGEVI